MLDSALASPQKPWQASGSLSLVIILVKDVVIVLVQSVLPGLQEGIQMNFSLNILMASYIYTMPAYTTSSMHIFRGERK